MIQDESKIELSGNMGRKERVPLTKRMKFQRMLMAKMLGSENPDLKVQEEWAERYEIPVSEIIDTIQNPDGSDVHGLIMDEKYEEAVEKAAQIL